MIYDYEIILEDKEEILYLYVDLNQEFARRNVKAKKKKLKEEIEDYVKKNKIPFHGKKVAILVGGLVVGTLLFNTPMDKNEKNSYNIENYTISTLVEVPTREFDQVDSLQVFSDESTTDSVQLEKSDNQNVDIVVSSSKGTNIHKQESINNSSVSSNMNQDSSIFVSESPIEEPKDNNTYITIYRSNGSILNLELEEYIIGVVGAEMPASFSLEALKAQAVIARTYALKAMERNSILTDNSSTQNYKTNAELQNMWGSSYNTYYNKIKNAVESTQGMYLTYNGEIIDAVYHSTSNGMTEDAKNVWGNAVPYLVSVESQYDSLNPSFQKSVVLSYETLTEKLGIPITSDTIFSVSSKTSGNRVETIKIDEFTYTGVQLRNLLGLRSADFEIEKMDNGFSFFTKGYGHGVGLSQYGANGMAKNGSTYAQILKHYYKGVTLSQKS